MIALGRRLAPRAPLIAPRGRVSEGGMARFFTREPSDPFRFPDLRERTRELAEFVDEALAARDLAGRPVVAVGYSNGANVATSLLLHHPGVLSGAALLRGMLPAPAPEGLDLSGVRVLVAAGRQDTLHPSARGRAAALGPAGARGRRDRAMGAGRPRPDPGRPDGGRLLAGSGLRRALMFGRPGGARDAAERGRPRGEARGRDRPGRALSPRSLEGSARPSGRTRRRTGRRAPAAGRAGRARRGPRAPGRAGAPPRRPRRRRREAAEQAHHRQVDLAVAPVDGGIDEDGRAAASASALPPQRSPCRRAGPRAGRRVGQAGPEPLDPRAGRGRAARRVHRAAGERLDAPRPVEVGPGLERARSAEAGVPMKLSSSRPNDGRPRGGAPRAPGRGRRRDRCPARPRSIHSSARKRGGRRRRPRRPGRAQGAGLRQPAQPPASARYMPAGASGGTSRTAAARRPAPRAARG